MSRSARRLRRYRQVERPGCVRADGAPPLDDHLGRWPGGALCRRGQSAERRRIDDTARHGAAPRQRPGGRPGHPRRCAVGQGSTRGGDDRVAASQRCALTRPAGSTRPHHQHRRRWRGRWRPDRQEDARRGHGQGRRRRAGRRAREDALSGRGALAGESDGRSLEPDREAVRGIDGGRRHVQGRRCRRRARQSHRQRHRWRTSTRQRRQRHLQPGDEPGRPLPHGQCAAVDRTLRRSGEQEGLRWSERFLQVLACKGGFVGRSHQPRRRCNRRKTASSRACATQSWSKSISWRRPR